MICLLQTHKDKRNSGDTDKRKEEKPTCQLTPRETHSTSWYISFRSFFYVNRVKAEAGLCRANCSVGCLPPAIVAAPCLSGAPLAPIPLIRALRLQRRRCFSRLPPQTPERMGGLGDGLSLSGGGEGAGGTCWAPGRGVLGLQLAGERGAGEEPTEGRERREAERGCRFPSGGGLFPTRAGPAAFLCQGVLPAP